MDNINKVSKIDTSLSDSAYRGSQNDKNVIKNLDGEKADNLVDAFPSEDIIELAKMMWKNTN